MDDETNNNAYNVFVNTTVLIRGFCLDLTSALEHQLLLAVKGRAGPGI